MSVSIQELHHKTQALESVIATLIAGISVNNPGLVGEVNRVLDENINNVNIPDGAKKALEEVKATIQRIKVVR